MAEDRSRSRRQTDEDRDGDGDRRVWTRLLEDSSRARVLMCALVSAGATRAYDIARRQVGYGDGHGDGDDWRLMRMETTNWAPKCQPKPTQENNKRKHVHGDTQGEERRLIVEGGQRT